MKPQPLPPTPNWPFPPPGGPAPWTREQEAAYQRAQRQKQKTEHANLEEPPL